MPTPAKTSRHQLIGIARALVEAGGVEALTVSAVAQGAGVKAPSLYKHFVDRAALLKAVEITILLELEAELRRETRGKTPKARLKSMAHAYRRFGKAAPNRYRVIYSGNAFTDPEIREACLFSAQPLFEELRAAGIAEERIVAAKDWLPQVEKPATRSGIWLTTDMKRLEENAELKERLKPILLEAKRDGFSDAHRAPAAEPVVTPYHQPTIAGPPTPDDDRSALPAPAAATPTRGRPRRG